MCRCTGSARAPGGTCFLHNPAPPAAQPCVWLPGYYLGRGAATPLAPGLLLVACPRPNGSMTHQLVFTRLGQCFVCHLSRLLGHQRSPDL